MNLLSVSVPFLFLATIVLGHGYGGGRRSAGYSSEYDCGGTCGGGCAYGNCGSSGPLIGPSGCETGECGGGSHRTSHTSSSHAGYHKSVTSVVKETRNDELKIVVGKPTQTVHRAAYIEQPVVHRTTYIEPQPVIHKTTYIEPAPVIIKKTRYVDDGDYAVSGCHGPCGGSKIVKVIKKTTYADSGSCNTCGSDYSSDVEYSQPTVVKKVTRIISEPKVVTTRVIKTRVVDQPSEFYEDSGPAYSHGGGRRYKSYGGGGGGAKAFAFASAGASAGGSYGGDSGEYSGGCKSGCDQWKK